MKRSNFLSCFAKVQVAWKLYRICTFIGSMDVRNNIYLCASSAQQQSLCHQLLAEHQQSFCAPNHWSGKSSLLSGCWVPIIQIDLSQIWSQWSNFVHITTGHINYKLHPLAPQHTHTKFQNVGFASEASYGSYGKNTITHSAVGLSIPLNEEAGAVPDDHPLQMRRHDKPTQKRCDYTLLQCKTKSTAIRVKWQTSFQQPSPQLLTFTKLL